MPLDSICEYFKTSKSTITNKASLIQDTYGITMFDSRFTEIEIAKSLDFSVTKEGMIIQNPNPSIRIESIVFEEEDDLKDISFYEQKLLYEREHAPRKPLVSRKRKPTNQLELFDDE